MDSSGSLTRLVNSSLEESCPIERRQYLWAWERQSFISYCSNSATASSVKSLYCSKRIGSPITKWMLPGIGIFEFRGYDWKAPSKASGISVALERLATAQKPSIRGRSSPSMVRVPSGKMTTDSPF